MTDLNLAHLRAIAEAASKRSPHSRWDYVNANCVGGNTVYGLRADDEESDFIACDVDVEAIGEHIATFSPPAVLALIARAEAAEKVAYMNATSGSFTFRQIEAMTRRAEKAEAALEEARASEWEACIQIEPMLRILKCEAAEYGSDGYNRALQNYADALRARVAQGRK